MGGVVFVGVVFFVVWVLVRKSDEKRMRPIREKKALEVARWKFLHNYLKSMPSLEVRIETNEDFALGFSDFMTSNRPRTDTEVVGEYEQHQYVWGWETAETAWTSRPNQDAIVDDSARSFWQGDAKPIWRSW